MQIHLLLCGVGGFERSLDGEEVAHGVALHDALYTFDVNRLLLVVAACDGEADLVAPEGGEVGIERGARQPVVVISIGEVQEAVSGIERDGLQFHPVIARAEWALRRRERHGQFFQCGFGDAETVLQRVGLIRRFVFLVADVEAHLHGGRIISAGLDVDVQNDHAAPLVRITERGAHGVERRRQHGVDLALREVVRDAG